MPMRVQEFHPAIAHFPIALFPTAVLADAIGVATDNQRLMDIGRMLMPVAVATMAATSLSGFTAQGAVRTNQVSEDILATHRNLNVSALIAAMAMAYLRARQEKPGMTYLAAGLAMSALLTYSGYLGGRMVYEHGVGVKPANGLQRGRSPQYPGNGLGRMARLIASDMTEAMSQTAQDAGEGRIVPHLRSSSKRSSSKRRSSSSRSRRKSR